MIGDSKPKATDIDCNNCERLSRATEYNPDEPFSSFCIGYRTGAIKGKEKSLENVPSDVFVVCTLIGEHSESCGQHRFVYNIADFYLEFRTLFIALEKAGLLKRVIEYTLRTSSDPITESLVAGVKRAKRRHSVEIGCKFIDFNCSCEEYFFREYNHANGGQYYKPTKADEKLFDIHRALGHTITYTKAKRVKHSRKGDNQFWQMWGPTEWRKPEDEA